MALASGLKVTDDSDMAYAELWNRILHADLGNRVISGCAVSPQTTPDLTVQVSSGSVLVNSSVVSVAGGNVDFSTEQASLASGQAMYAYVYVDSAGALQKVAGTAATAGQQYPPDDSLLPADCVVLARILLTYGDNSIDNADIKDLRIFPPDSLQIKNYLLVGNDPGSDLGVKIDANKNVMVGDRRSGSYRSSPGLYFWGLRGNAGETPIYAYWKLVGKASDAYLSLLIDTGHGSPGEAMRIRDTEVYFFDKITAGNGVGSDSAVELLKLNSPRSWSFYQKRQSAGADSSTALYLLSSTASKSLFIGDISTGTIEPSVEVFTNTTESGRFFKVWGKLYLRNAGAGGNPYWLSNAVDQTADFYGNQSFKSTYGFLRLAKGIIQRDDRDSSDPKLQIAFNRYLNTNGAWQEIDNTLNGWTIEMSSGGWNLWYSPAGSTTWTRMLKVDTGRNLSVIKQIYAFNLYRGPSSTVTVTDSDGIADENSLTVLDNAAIPAASALPRADYAVKAGVNVTGLSGDGLAYVKVVILKNNAAWLDSGYQQVTATGKIFVTVGTNVSFADDIYDIVLYVKAFKSGTTNESIIARLDSVVAYV